MNLYPPAPSLGGGDTRFNGLGEDVSFRSLLSPFVRHVSQGFTKNSI